MGEVSILNTHQKELLDEIAKNKYLASSYYFTGGTALSEVYLHHRESIDLDFFSPQKLEEQSLLHFFTDLQTRQKFTLSSRFIDPVLIYDLTFPDGQTLKVDFAHYPYKQLATPTALASGLPVDSLLDIAVNKLVTTTQRAEIKDFVDLFFLLQQFSFWDLREGVRVKFGVVIEPYVMANDWLAVENFEYLPKMVKPLTLDQLKVFFREKSVGLGKQFVE